MKQKTTNTVTSRGMWICENPDGEEAVFDRKDQVFPFTSRVIKEKARGRIAVAEDVGARSSLLRFIFAMNPRIIQNHIALEWADNAASLIFFDDAESEYRAQDFQNPKSFSEEIRKKIAHGEPEPHPADECMSLERALTAMDEYLNTGKRPGWLKYRYVP
jgi:hypothetical protein